MSEPNRLSIKRKATEEDPPDYLVLQKARQNETNIRYIRQKRVKESDADGDGAFATKPDLKPAKEMRQMSRRTFELQHSHFRPRTVNGKRKGSEDLVATFVERKRKQTAHSNTSKDDEIQLPHMPSASPHKRPGKGSAVKTTARPPVQPETEADKKQIEAIADYMHQAALEEIKRESRPKSVAAPKLSGAKSRDIHRQRVATNGAIHVGQDVDMEEENGYVYDTYILAPTTDDGAVQVDAQEELHNIGYIVITEQDEPFWETYLEDEPSEKDWNSDEDDENAEDYYGADYPEDEIASDDEFERDPYGYRGHGVSDDEEWDEDTGAYSDADSDSIPDPFRNNKTPQQFVKYLEAKAERN